MQTSLQLPTSAFLSVTLLCNSRCIHCDIWKHKGIDFLPLSIYKKLPPSLEMIDITGGEPFLRPDIPELVGVIRQTCPKARILITTNGFLVEKIRSQIAAVVQNDPNIAIRISLDGWGKTHEKIRNIPNAFSLVMQSIQILKDANVKDIGIIFTLMNKNYKELRQVFSYCKKNHLAFSLNVVHDSPIYFGKGKTPLSPNPALVQSDFHHIVSKQLLSLSPKDWAKAWFNYYSYQYLITKRRPLPCGAGENFFYMDPAANIFMCHLKNWPIGNLKTQNFMDIWKNNAKQGFLPKAHACNDCWIICTAKDAIKKNAPSVLKELPNIAITVFSS